MADAANLSSATVTGDNQVLPVLVTTNVTERSVPGRTYTPGASSASRPLMNFTTSTDGVASPRWVGTSSTGRRVAEFMKKSFDRIGVRVEFDTMPPGDRLKRMSTCKHQLTTMDFGGGAPDGVSAMENFYSRHIGTVNLSCYASPDYDATYEKLRPMPAGPARAPLFRHLTELLDAHAPARVLPLADDIYLVAPGVLGFAPHPYLSLPYHLLDVTTTPGR